MTNTIPSRLQTYAARGIQRPPTIDQRLVSSPLPVALFYLLALTLAELLTVWAAPRLGQALYLLLLFLLLLHTAITWVRPVHRFLLALAFVPIIRVVSISLPLDGIPLIYWYLIVSIPLFAAVFVVMRILRIRLRARALRGRGLLLQFAIGLTGIALGAIEYLILRPEPHLLIYSWDRLLLAALILLVSTGILEELIFRGIMQRAATNSLGNLFGLIYVAFIFAMLHLGYQSPADLLFVFIVGLAYGWFVLQTGSLLGVTLSHWLINVVLFLVIPFMVSANGHQRPVTLDTLFQWSQSSQQAVFADPLPTVLPAAAPSKSASSIRPPSKTNEVGQTNEGGQSTEIVKAQSPPVTGPSGQVPLGRADFLTHSGRSATSAKTESSLSSGCPPVPRSWLSYEIRPGDTLFSLAANNGTYVNTILQANCLDRNVIFSGAQILLPRIPVDGALCRPPAGWAPYTVQPGDTLSSLALSRSTTVQAIIQANCLPSDLIIANTQLMLPAPQAPS
jgi:membrane protease YdiL (CAAX protease family)/LysM repeat protein